MREEYLLLFSSTMHTHAGVYTALRAPVERVYELCDAWIPTYGCMIATDRCISLGMHLRACWTSFAETLMDKRSLYGYSERGSSWPFTYLCYDFASLDLIDGIAINLRISRGDGKTTKTSRREAASVPRPETTRKPLPVYIYTHVHTCTVFICTRVYTAPA